MTTLQGAQVHEHDEGRTLDLTKLRLSVGQVLVVFALLSGMAGTAAVIAWRVDSNSQAIEKMATNVDKLAESVQKVAQTTQRTADRVDAIEDDRRAQRDMRESRRRD